MRESINFLFGVDCIGVCRGGGDDDHVKQLQWVSREGSCRCSFLQWGAVVGHRSVQALEHYFEIKGVDATDWIIRLITKA